MLILIWPSLGVAFGWFGIYIGMIRMVKRHPNELVCMYVCEGYSNGSRGNSNRHVYIYVGDSNRSRGIRMDWNKLDEFTTF